MASSLINAVGLIFHTDCVLNFQLVFTCHAYGNHSLYVYNRMRVFMYEVKLHSKSSHWYFKNKKSMAIFILQ